MGALAVIKCLWCVQVDDEGHYSGIYDDIDARRASVRKSSAYDLYHYIDIDRINADDGDGDHPGSRDQAARSSQGYEGLDPSTLATQRQRQRPQDYEELGVGEATVSKQPAAEEIEMRKKDQQNAVS